jgi:hypothetical protein
MKKLTVTAPVPVRLDASLDTRLNPVELNSKEIVSWAAAFPRPGRAKTPLQQA